MDLRVDMDGNRQVLCCLSGEWVNEDDAVRVVLVFPGTDGIDETQVLFAKKGELVRVIVPGIPLHPELDS